MAVRNGFTLVELLVAIAIFAVLSALGWQVFDYMNKVKSRNVMHEAALEQLQMGYQQLLKDTAQIVPMSATVNNQQEPALLLQNGRLSFSKAGVTDPLQQGLAAYERIEYRYDANQKIVYRLKYLHLDRDAQLQPISSELMTDVERFEITVLNPNVVNQWPQETTQSDRLPRGVEIQLQVREMPYVWRFSVLPQRGSDQ